MHAFQIIMNFVVFPIFGLSGAIFPINNLPSFLKILTLFNPLTYGVDGIRYGLLNVSQINPLICLTVLIIFNIFMAIIGATLFKKIKA